MSHSASTHDIETVQRRATLVLALLAIVGVVILVGKQKSPIFGRATFEAVEKDSATLTWHGKTMTKGVQENPTFAWLKSRIESKGCKGLNMIYHQRNTIGFMTDLSCEAGATTVTVEGRGVSESWVNTPASFKMTVHSDNTVTCSAVMVSYKGVEVPLRVRPAVCMLRGGPPATPTPTHYDLRIFFFSEEQGDWVSNLQSAQVHGLYMEGCQGVRCLVNTVGTIPTVMVKTSSKVITFSANPGYWSNNGDRPLRLRGEYIHIDGSLVALTVQAGGWSSSNGYKYTLQTCWVDNVSKTGDLLLRKYFLLNAVLEPTSFFGGAKCDGASIKIVF